MLRRSALAVTAFTVLLTACTSDTAQVAKQRFDYADATAGPAFQQCGAGLLARHPALMPAFARIGTRNPERVLLNPDENAALQAFIVDAGACSADYVRTMEPVAPNAAALERRLFGQRTALLRSYSAGQLSGAELMELLPLVSPSGSPAMRAELASIRQNTTQAAQGETQSNERAKQSAREAGQTLLAVGSVALIVAGAVAASRSANPPPDPPPLPNRMPIYCHRTTFDTMVCQ